MYDNLKKTILYLLPAGRWVTVFDVAFGVLTYYLTYYDRLVSRS